MLLLDGFLALVFLVGVWCHTVRLSMLARLGQAGTRIEHSRLWEGAEFVIFANVFAASIVSLCKQQFVQTATDKPIHPQTCQSLFPWSQKLPLCSSGANILFLTVKSVQTLIANTPCADKATPHKPYFATPFGSLSVCLSVVFECVFDQHH